ncbi:MAG: glycosyltransferase [Candidatus Pacebacteria bacterium]|nr:glycosyltransferase [Candidatus Paceibacterota bacterium]
MIIGEILIYTAIFIGLYFAIFVFGTFFEYKDKIYYKPKRKCLPKVSLLVPCYNEEENIEKTIVSILNLDYPKENLEIIIIDDGSCDNTLRKAQELSQNDSRIKVFHKENGGKYTALNFGIQKSTNPYIGTVDADSFLHEESLKKIMHYFENPKIMAVISTVKIASPRSILEGVQYVEYLMAAFYRKAFAFLNSVSVVPGPLSVFNKKVFAKLGPYKKAHQTEDFEFALRMQKANLPIAYAIDAVVYTQGCCTFMALLRQRLRWNRGFLLNVKDYPELLNVKKHGNLSFLLLNSVVSCFIGVALFLFGLYQFFDLVYTKSNQLFLTKADFFNFSWSLPDWMKFDITPIFFLGMTALTVFFAYLIFSKKFTHDPGPSKRNVVFYLVIYPFINSIFWIATFWTVIFRKKELVWK